MTKKKSSLTTRFLSYLDAHLLVYCTAFLLAFIPLYPKLPLFDIIPGYIVRVRLEDLFILGTSVIWAVQVLRKKAQLKTPLTPILTAYVVTAVLSTLSALFVIKTVPLHEIHIQKTVLHLLRNIEYFIVFFITFSAIKSKKDVILFLKVILLTFMAVTLYGVGQKYLYWPVYSTMNREFSKGIRLYLTEHARVQSTFGGHYDLAAYIVMVLPLTLLALFATTKKVYSYFLWMTFALGTWLLVVSAARTSFAATLVAITAALLLSAQKQTKPVIFFLKYASIVGAIFLFTFIQFGDDIYSRLLDTLEGYPKLHTAYHTANAQRKYVLYEYIPETLGLSGTMKDMAPQVPEGALSTDELDEVLIATDQQPVFSRPNDVYVDVPDIVKVATTSATGKTEIILIEQPRTYSDNALRYGLSMAIRLDTLWPQAWQGFLKNPLLGSGYATLTKSSVAEFTEADSTDNNFLRVLGELGIVGFITFFGAIAVGLFHAYKLFTQQQKITLETALGIGYISATIGLLLNAIFIDVFVSSKVAFTFWILTGMVVALTQIKKKQEK